MMIAVSRVEFEGWFTVNCGLWLASHVTMGTCGDEESGHDDDVGAAGGEGGECVRPLHSTCSRFTFSAPTPQERPHARLVPLAQRSSPPTVTCHCKHAHCPPPHPAASAPATTAAQSPPHTTRHTLHCHHHRHHQHGTVQAQSVRAHAAREPVTAPSSSCAGR